MSRELSAFEAKNIRFLAGRGLDFGWLFTTPTILEKSYFDATDSFRAFLSASKIHDYMRQPQGQEHKVRVEASCFDTSGYPESTEATLYRPNTKQGDPRIWFSRLHRFFRAGEVALVVARDGALWVFNGSKTDLQSLAGSSVNVGHLLEAEKHSPESVLQELVESLTSIHRRGFIRTHRRGSTAVGHLIESELGIEANSSKLPDYKGIELKSTRGQSQNGQTMFAQVASWGESKVKSSREMLDTFGYERDGKFRLNCSVSTARPNSQGLQLVLDEPDGKVHEVYVGDGKMHPALTWEIETLKARLAEKHKHTLWIRAESRIIDDVEHIRYLNARYTSAPILDQFSPLVASAGIYLDHLISRPVDSQSTGERGPLFKIQPTSFTKMFADPREISFQ